MAALSAGLRVRAARVRLLVLDVDGVLTDGRLYYGPNGEPLKRFHAHDGMGIRLLAQEGVQVAVISARDSAPLRRRVQDLRISHAVLGCDHKASAFTELVQELGCTQEETAFVGDDIIDLGAMRAAGLSITVADAYVRVRNEADWTTTACGGDGAVREIADAMLDARGALADAIERLIQGTARGGTKITQ